MTGFSSWKDVFGMPEKLEFSPQPFWRIRALLLELEGFFWWLHWVVGITARNLGKKPDTRNTCIGLTWLRRWEQAERASSTLWWAIVELRIEIEAILTRGGYEFNFPNTKDKDYSTAFNNY